MDKRCLLIAISTLAMSFNSSAQESFSVFKAQFCNPPSAYRPAPLNVWNGIVTDTESERMMKALHGKGFGAAFIHPRPGLITPYMSSAWISAYHKAVNYGKSNGMYVWIYDENSYPSGFGGGMVPEQMPESYNEGVGLEEESFITLPNDANDYYLCLVKQGDQWKNITDIIQSYKNKNGVYRLYRKTYYERTPWYGGYSYVDLLKKGVTEKFLETTMGKYERALGAEFGKTIPGVFSDEPNIMPPTGKSIRWTPDLFEVFRQRWGYDLISALPSLFDETGDWRRVRYDYMETLQYLFVERWAKPYHDYCEKHGLLWTGHYWEHEWPYVQNVPDNMAMYAWHQQPAIDMLFNQFSEESPVAQFGNVRSVKELRSVANQIGQQRTLSETYGGGSWAETFEDFKRLGDWEYVLGVNFMNQHLVHQTLQGARKYDYPPVFSYHSPWWEDYKYMNDYFGRLSYVLSQGMQENDVLVLEPTTTVWSYYSYTHRNPELKTIGYEFQAFVTRLEKKQVEYDLGSEWILRDHGSVQNGCLHIGKASYHTVIIPPGMENFMGQTLKLLRDFEAQGGTVYGFSKPTYIDGVKNSDAELLKISELSENALISALTKEQSLKVSGVGGDLYHQTRAITQGKVIFLVNSSLAEGCDGIVKGGFKSIAHLDAEKGTITEYSHVSGNEASFHLEPAGSLLLLLSNEKLDLPADDVILATRELAASSPLKVKRLEDNALNIDFCDIKVKGKTYNNLYFAAAADSIYRAFGFSNGDPWNTSVQNKSNILDSDTITNDGFEATYYFTVDGKFDYKSFKLVAEHPDYFTMAINGHEVKATPGAWKLDKDFGLYDIGRFVRQGKNIVHFSLPRMRVLAELQPIYLFGNFDTTPALRGFTVTAPTKDFSLGSWRSQGQNFYSWTMSYSKHYNIKKLARHYEVKLREWKGTVAEVYVNGSKAGIIPYHPYKLDITRFMRKGDNTIDVRIIGSNKNIFGSFYTPEEKGIAGPWQWKGSKEPIPGNKYDQLDYGLMEDFSVMY